MTTQAEGQWQNAAACLGHDTALWFPHTGDNNSEAKAICNTCPAQRDCLNYALDNAERYGIWGGKTALERRTLRRLMRRPDPHKRTGEPPNWIHGTDAAYRQHSRYGIPLCEPCRQAHRDNRPGAA